MCGRAGAISRSDLAVLLIPGAAQVGVHGCIHWLAMDEGTLAAGVGHGECIQ